MRLQQKSDSHWLSRQRQAVLLFSSIFALISGLSSPAQAQVLSSRRQLPRIAITPSSATVTTGKAMNFKIAMLDAAGKPAPAGSDLAVQLTLTSMPKLDAAKKQISVKEQSRAEQKAPQLKALNQQMIKLASGQTFSRLEGVFTKGQSEITLQVLVQQTGQIRLFAESGNFQPGEAVLIAVSPAIRSRRYSWNGGKSVDDYRAGAAAIASSPDRLSTIFRPDSSSEPQPVWRRAAWQDTPPGSTATAEIPRFKLELNTPGV